MGFIIQTDDQEILKRNLRAANLVKETKLLNIARLAKMLVDLYGLDNQFKRLKKREGQEVELFIPALEGYITLVLTSDRNKFDVRVEKAKNPVSTIEVKVDENSIVSEDMKDELNDVKESVKIVIDQAKEALIKAKDEFNKPDNKEVVVEKEQPKEEVIISKEPELEDKLESLDNEKKPEDEMKSL